MQALLHHVLIVRVLLAKCFTYTLLCFDIACMIPEDKGIPSSVTLPSLCIFIGYTIYKGAHADIGRPCELHADNGPDWKWISFSHRCCTETTLKEATLFEDLLYFKNVSIL